MTQKTHPCAFGLAPKAGFGRGMMAPSCLAIFVAALPTSLKAAEVLLTTDDAFGSSSLNSVGNWSNGQAPAAGNQYLTGGFTLRTPAQGGSVTFAGDTLSIDAGGRFLGKGGGSNTSQTITVNQLILNGGTLDQAVSTSSTNILLTLAGNISVNQPSVIGASGGGNNSANFETLEIVAPISGFADLTIGGMMNNGQYTGVVKLSAANPYQGRISVAQPNAIASATHRLLQLNHPDALRNATLVLSTTTSNGVSFAAAANTAPFRVGGLGGAASQLLMDTANEPVTLEVGGTGLDSEFSGNLGGRGHFVKRGAGTVILQEQNTYLGSTTIAGGRLVLRKPSLSDLAPVSIATGAVLQLDHTETDAVSELVLGGVTQPPGIYNASTPGGFIAGAGSIEVYTGAPPPQNISLVASDTGNLLATSFNGDIGHWSVPGAPVEPNHYFTGPYWIRTPAITESGDSGTFGGSSLTIDAGGRFLGKAGASMAGSNVVQTLSVKRLILNGGLLDQAGSPSSNAKLVLGGIVEVRASSSVGALGSGQNNGSYETLEIAATIEGEEQAQITVGGSANGGGNTGLVKLSAANPYRGVIIVAQPGNGAIASETERLLQLNHRDAVQNALLVLSTTAANGISFSAQANTGPFRVDALEGTASQTLADVNGAPVTLDIGGAGSGFTLEGALGGPGSVIKSGAGTGRFNGENTYTGSTTLSGGVLQIARATLHDSARVSIANGAVLELLHNSTDVVGSLVLAGASQPDGVYDASNSGGRISGTGKLQVISSGSGGFEAFMDGFPALSAADKEPGADPDGDGIINLLEYALAGLNPTMADSLPSLQGGVLSFSKRPLAVENDDVVYLIEVSSTLGQAPDPWTPAAAVETATSISYTLPAGLQRHFARLRVELSD